MNAQTITATRTPMDKARHRVHLENLLERLRQGPVTAGELGDHKELYGLNPRARISDARKAGHNVVCVRGGEGGVNTYRIAPRPVAFDGRQAVMFGEWQGGEIDPVWAAHK